MPLSFPFKLVFLSLLANTLTFNTDAFSFLTGNSHTSLSYGFGNRPLNTHKNTARNRLNTSFFSPYSPLDSTSAPTLNSRSSTLYSADSQKGTVRGISGSRRLVKQGTVIDCGPSANFTVLMDESNKKLRCSLSGRLFYRKVRIWNNSRVKVEVDLMYPETGTIIERIDS